MARLTFDRMDGQLVELSSGEPPPSWVLADPSAADDVREHVPGSGLTEMAFDPISGAFEWTADGRIDPADIAWLVDLADPGREVHLDDVDRTEAASWLRTRVDDHDVIGQGGRVSVYSFPSRTTISLVVRRRDRQQPMTWRPLADVERGVNEYLSRWRGRVVTAEVGYYEAGRSTRQTRLDYCVQVIVENDVEQNEGPWRSVVVEPLVRPTDRELMSLLQPDARELLVTDNPEPSPTFNGVLDTLD